MRRFAVFLVAGLPLVVLGCLARTSGVEFLHTQLPAKPYGCAVNRIATDSVPYPVENLAVVTLTYTPGGKDLAMNKLADETCYYGGDTLYRIAESATGNGTTELKGTIARRPGGTVDAAAASAGASASAHP